MDSGKRRRLGSAGGRWQSLCGEGRGPAGHSEAPGPGPMRGEPGKASDAGGQCLPIEARRTSLLVWRCSRLKVGKLTWASHRDFETI